MTKSPNKNPVYVLHFLGETQTKPLPAKEVVRLKGTMV